MNGKGMNENRGQKETITEPKEENIPNDLSSKKANLYQSLNKLARKMICVPATSAPTERVFSQSDLLMTSDRSSSSQSNICILTSLTCNETLNLNSYCQLIRFLLVNRLKFRYLFIKNDIFIILV